MRKEHYRCGECNTLMPTARILNAKNPFYKEETISGCPICFSIDHFVLVCDAPHCKRDVTCGTPTKKGYRNTCGPHAPRWGE